MRGVLVCSVDVEGAESEGWKQGGGAGFFIPLMVEEQILWFVFVSLIV